MLEQLYPNLTGGGQVALGRGGDHFLKVLQGALSTFVEAQEGAHKVDVVAGIVLGTFRGQRLLLFRQRMEGFGLSRVDDEIGLRHWRGRRPCRAPSKEETEHDHRHESVLESLHADPSGFATRRINRTVVPFLASLSIQIRPPCASTTFLASANPRPLPGVACLPLVRP